MIRNGIDYDDEDFWKEVCEHYQSHTGTLTKTSKFFGIGDPILSRKLKERGIEVRSSGYHHKKHSCNSSYFEKINSVEKAQVLGAIWADGGIVYPGCNNTGRNDYSLNFSQVKNRKYYVKHIKEALGYSGPISDRECGQGSIKTISSVIHGIKHQYGFTVSLALCSYLSLQKNLILDRHNNLIMLQHNNLILRNSKT